MSEFASLAIRATGDGGDFSRHVLAGLGVDANDGPPRGPIERERS